VVQWGLLYVAGAWGFLQGLEYLAETFHWPEQLRQVAVLALLVGLPIVLVLAWYHGDRGEQRVRGIELVIVAALFLLGAGILWWYERTSGSATSAANEADTTTPSNRATDARPAIAVLIFENRSGVEDDAYFVDGIHDDILTQLSKISGLKVISRTSVERFRKSELSVQEIARQLGVNSILEGGVQRAGDRVRINVQLIDASTDTHVWAESYDRELTASNVFAIQSEVATSIAGAMKTALTPAERERAKRVSTQNLDAWEAYQLGRQQMAKRTTEALGEAAGFFQRAIDLDPAFAQAYAGLADAIWLKADYGGEPWEPAAVRAQALAEAALELDANLAEALTTLAKMSEARGDFVAAESGYRRAIELEPNYVPALQWYSGVLGKQGRDEEALSHARTAVILDPLSAPLRAALGTLLVGLGRFDEGLREIQKANRLDPGSPAPYVQIGMVTARVHGRIDQAIAWLEKAADLDPANTSTIAALAVFYLDLMDDAGSKRWIERGRGENDANDLNEAAAIRRLYLGDAPGAVSVAERFWKLEPQARWSLALLRNADLQAGRDRIARRRYAEAFPEWFTEGRPTVIDLHYGAAIDLALVLQSTGERDRARQLLDASELVIQRIPRLGYFGYGLDDARMHAIRGDEAKALSALREAENSGWRGPFWRYYRDFDPNLALIRNEPEFKAIFADIERDMARQHAALAARPKNAPLDLASTQHTPSANSYSRMNRKPASRAAVASSEAPKMLGSLPTIT
jgi:TolB-like protein/Tfp pilus assembly protein PilF